MVRLRDFIRDERGSSTVEWVVLTAVTVGMALGTMNVIQGGAADASGDLEDRFESPSDGARPTVQVVYDMDFVNGVKSVLNGFTVEEMSTVTAFMDEMQLYFAANPDLLSESEKEIISDFDVGVDLVWMGMELPRPTGGTWTQEAIDALPGEFQPLAYTQ